MIRNYLIVAVRNLLKSRLYSAINILGLAVGLAACVAIILYVRDELSYDRWIPDAERIYRVHTRFDIPGRQPLLSTSSSAPVLPALQRDFDRQIESGARVMRMTATFMRGTEPLFEAGAFADPSFFDVLNLPLAAGDRATALSDPAAMAVSRAFARKYFGADDAVGRTLTLKSQFGSREVRIAAVFEDLPANTHLADPTLAFDFVSVLDQPTFDAAPYLQRWGVSAMWTYVKLAPDADATALAGAMPDFIKRNATDSPEQLSLSFMSLPDLRLNVQTARGSNNRRVAVTAFSGVAALILVIAVINFTNLATARATQRAREVALRKVLGAHRVQVMTQFLGESLIVVSIAVAVALILVEAALPAINGFVGKSLALSYLGSGSVLPYVAGLVAIVALLGGLYPAFYLSAFEPARVLKMKAETRIAGAVSLREILVVAQFAISIALITCTAIVYRQVDYVRNLDLGFERDGLIVVRGVARPEVTPRLQALQQELRRVPGITAALAVGAVPTDGSNRETTGRRVGSGDTDPIAFSYHVVDHGWVEAYGVRLLAGRDLSAERDTGKTLSDGTAIFLNANALGRFGFRSPEQAIGQQLEVNNGPKTVVTTTIIGVVQNLYYQSARAEVAPMIFFRDEAQVENLVVRYAGSNPDEARSAVEQVWRQIVPDVPFRADHMPELVERLYRNEAAQAAMFTGFSVLAIAVACLGLYGLAFFMAERRTKEIGLRKVVGARVRDIVRLLLWQLSRPITIAALIAWPVAYLIMRDWLDGFEFRIALSPVFFIGAGVLATVIAWATVMSHAVRVARANPIHALRYE